MAKEDKWKDRSKGLACVTCMYWVEKTPLEKIEGDSNPPLGRCRRHAPTLAGWVAVYSTDWCGDHKLDENKI